MKVSNIASVAAVALAALSSTAHAQGWMRSSQDLGFYVGVGIGRAEAKDFCSDARSRGLSSCDEKDKTWKVSAGYRFHRNVAVEAGYADLGKFTASGTIGVTGTTVRADVKAYELLAVGIIPVAQAFSVYGKAGVARWDVDARATGALVGVGDKGTDFTFGVGAQYDFTPNLAARVEWQRYMNVDVSTLGVAFLYMFR